MTHMTFVCLDNDRFIYLYNNILSKDLHVDRFKYFTAIAINFALYRILLKYELILP